MYLRDDDSIIHLHISLYSSLSFTFFFICIPVKLYLGSKKKHLKSI